MKGNTLFINPGEVCAREKPISESVMLEVLDGSFKVIYYFRKLSEKEWRIKEIGL
jgi:predicted phosphodiesterase